MFEEKETEIETGSVDSVDNVNWSWEATDLLNHTPTESTTTTTNTDTDTGGGTIDWNRERFRIKDGIKCTFHTPRSEREIEMDMLEVAILTLALFFILCRYVRM